MSLSPERRAASAESKTGRFLADARKGTAPSAPGAL